MDAVIDEKIRCVGVNLPIVGCERNLDRLGNDVKNAEAKFFADQEVAFKRRFVRTCSRSSKQKCQESEMDELQTGIEMSLAVFP